MRKKSTQIRQVFQQINHAFSEEIKPQGKGILRQIPTHEKNAQIRQRSLQLTNRMDGLGRIDLIPQKVKERPYSY